MRRIRYSPNSESSVVHFVTYASHDWLASIEPAAPDHDKRTFECPACPNIVVRIGKYRSPATQSGQRRTTVRPTFHRG